MRGKGMRQQSALELLTTYSWALLIIAIFVAAVAIINSARPATNYLASSCTIEPLLPCTQTLLTYNSFSPIKFSILFDNNLGQTMFFPTNALNITISNIGTRGVSYATGNCTPALALQGTPILCSAYIPGSIKPPIGTQETITFTLSYQLCKGNSQGSCPSTTYRTTGQSSQTMAPSATSFHKLVVQANPTSGTVNLNGVTYLNNANVLLLTNNYNVYAIPPSGYKFSSWGISVGSGGGTSSLSSASAQNSVLALGSNATLTANFGAIGSTSTVTLTSTSTTTTTSTWVTTTTIAPALLAGAITPSAPTLDSGQSVTLTSAASGGTTPYSYSWYSGGSSTCTSDSAVGGQTSSTYAPSPSSSTYYCYQVGDSSTPQQFTKSATDLVTVNSALSAGAVTASGTTLDSGQTVTLTSHPSGGTTAYSYVWYSGSSATCSSDGAVGGQTSSTYAPSPSSSTYYCYQVTDSATSPESAKSATILITVNSALAAGAITPSSPSIYTGGSGVTLSSAASGGTTAYSYQWYVASGGTNPSCAAGDAIGGGTSSTYSANPSSTSTYTYKVTDSASAPEQVCSAADTVTVSTPYVPITLTNSQSAATGAIPVPITINSDNYASYIASNWNNVVFTTGPADTGSNINAWIETNPVNTATNTMVWVKLPSSISGSGGTLTIYMNFMPSSQLSSSGPLGEAPQFSGTYGQYDDGGVMGFTTYDGFTGSSFVSPWYSNGGSVSNKYSASGVTGWSAVPGESTYYSSGIGYLFIAALSGSPILCWDNGSACTYYSGFGTGVVSLSNPGTSAFFIVDSDGSTVSETAYWGLVAPYPPSGTYPSASFGSLA